MNYRNLYALACPVTFCLIGALSMPRIASPQAIGFDIASTRAYRISGSNQIQNERASDFPKFGGGSAVLPAPFSQFPQARFRLTGISGASTSPIPLPRSFDSGQGLTLRAIVQTATSDSKILPIAQLSSVDGLRSLIVGHDDHSWMVGRNANPSPKYDLLKPRALWTTPWDPIYDAKDQTVIFYLRITPIGTAYLDRFLPFRNAVGQIQISWEESVQLGTFSMGPLTVGHDTPGNKSAFTNPAAWNPISFNSLQLGSTFFDGIAGDVLRDLSVKSASVSDTELLSDVAFLIPEGAAILTQPDLLPCNTGSWLNRNIDQAAPGITPCGPIAKYAPIVMDSEARQHYGPPAGRQGYVTGLPGWFTPGAILNLRGAASAGAYSWSWSPPQAVEGYNYLLVDVTADPNGVFVAGGFTTNAQFTFSPNSGRKYRFYIAPCNALGVGATTFDDYASQPVSPLSLAIHYWTPEPSPKNVPTPFLGAAIQPNTRFLYTIGSDQLLYVSTQFGADALTVAPKKKILSLSFAPDGSIIALGTDFKFYQKAGPYGDSPWKSMVLDGPITSAAILPNLVLLGTSIDRKIYWKPWLRPDEVWIQMEGTNSSVSVSALPDGTILTVREDGNLYASKGLFSKTVMISNTVPLRSISVSPDSTLLGTGKDGKLYTMRNPLSAPIWTSIENAGAALSVASLADGSVMAVDGTTGTLKWRPSLNSPWAYTGSCCYRSVAQEPSGRIIAANRQTLYVDGLANYFSLPIQIPLSLSVFSAKPVAGGFWIGIATDFSLWQNGSPGTESWSKLPWNGLFLDVAQLQTGAIIAVGKDGKLYIKSIWNEFYPIDSPNGLASVNVMGDGSLMGTNASGTIQILNR